MESLYGAILEEPAASTTLAHLCSATQAGGVGKVFNAILCK